MVVRSFLDSDVFVYADDHRCPAKQATSLELYEHARATGLGVVSTQVMQDYFSVAVGKIRMPSDLARRRS